VFIFEVHILSGLFYSIGRMVGPKLRKGKWLWTNLTGSEAEAIAAEYGVGCDLAAEVRVQVQPCTDASKSKLLSEIGSHLVLCVGNKQRRFNFEAVQGGQANAFALPGGFIFVTDALIELCERSRDEIAFVLAHEMSHVMRGHAMERLLSDTAFSGLARRLPARGAIAGWLKRVGVKFLETAYSRSRESEADELAVRLIRAGGFDCGGAVQLLKRLATLKEQRGEDGLGVYFSSHPPIAERIRDVERLLKKQH